jgi:hypothetical protein
MQLSLSNEKLNGNVMKLSANVESWKLCNAIVTTGTTIAIAIHTLMDTEAGKKVTRNASSEREPQNALLRTRHLELGTLLAAAELETLHIMQFRCRCFAVPPSTHGNGLSM